MPGFDDVLWSHEVHGNYYYARTGMLICNGVFITERLHGIEVKISPELDLISVATPTIVVFDPDGRFPINLQRNEISAKSLPFEMQLADSVADQAARDLANAFKGTSAEITIDRVKLSLDPKMKGKSRVHERVPSPAPIMLTKQGMLPADLSLIWKAKPESILLDACNIAKKQGAWSVKEVIRTLDTYMAVNPVAETKSSRIDFISAAIGGQDRNREMSRLVKLLPILGRRIFLRKDQVAELVSAGNVPPTYWAKLRLEVSDATWGIWSLGRPPTLEFDFEELSAQMTAASCFGFAKVYFDWNSTTDSKQPESDSPFASAWLSTVGAPHLIC